MSGGWTLISLPAALLWPSLGWAQDSAAGLETARFAWLPFAVAAVAVAALLLCLRRSRMLGVELAAMRRTLDRITQVERTSADQTILWDDRTATVQVSAGLAALLGRDGDAVGFEALMEGADDEAAGRVSDAVRGLREDGVSFDLVVPETDRRGPLRLTGERIAPAGLSVLWVRDGRREAAKLRELEKRTAGLEKMVDALPLPIWRRNATLDIDLFNKSYANAVELDGARAVAAVPELTAGGIARSGRALASHALATGEIQSHRTHIVIGGSRKLIELTEVPLDGADATAGFALDRTEIESVQSELSRHVAGHEGVLQNLGTAIAIYGADQKLVFFNNAFMQLWRLEESWLRTEPDMGGVLEVLRERRLLPEYANFPMFKQEQLKLFTSLLEPMEDLVHLPNGTTLRSVIAPHALGGLLLTWEDVTDALALERSYNTLIAVQRETLDHLYEGVAVIGGDGRLKLSNPAFGRIWQLPPDLLASEPHISKLVDQMRDLIGAIGDWSAEKDDIIGLLTDREPQSGRLERTDGSVLDFATVPLPDGAVLLSYLDVTDSNQVERALRERNEALETADRLKSEFIASVSYELRTPLNTIIGFAEILTGEYFGGLNDRQKEYSQGVLESSHRLLSLINNILDLATIEAGHMALELDTINLHDMLSDVLGLMAERMRKKRLIADLDCPREIGTIVADERRLKQALFNMLSNAIKFTPDRGRVTLAVGREADGVRLTCVDTGIGIAEADRTRVFGKFERGSHPEARRSGAGLGLSLVKSFIELHGGHVELDSEPGVGTRVSCWLPSHGVETVPAELGVAGDAEPPAGVKAGL